MARFRDSNTFGPTLDAAAERLGISSTAVEKDYWVSEVLRVLMSEFGANFVFKGGTSLSKGYRIVERFSEDIDILVLPGERGRGGTDRLMKDMGAAAAGGIGGGATPFGGSETGRHRSFEIAYPATRKPTQFVRTSLILEMGVRGGAHPHDAVQISCLLGDVLQSAGTALTNFTDLEPFDVVALHPGRTLLEKLSHIQVAAQELEANPSSAADPRIGRHFYDVFQLLGDERVLALLHNRDEFGLVMSSVGDVTRSYFGGGDEVELRPEGGFAMSLAFDVDNDVSIRMRAAYEATMPELYFGVDPLPTWQQIAQRIMESRGLL